MLIYDKRQLDFWGETFRKFLYKYQHKKKRFKINKMKTQSTYYKIN
jgi:hypothetical protein